MRRCTSILGSLFVMLFIAAHVPMGPSVPDAEAVAMQQSREARSSSRSGAQGERSRQTRSSRERSTRTRGERSTSRTRSSSNRRGASAESRSSSAQRSTGRVTRPGARGRTQPRRSARANRPAPRANVSTPRPRPAVRYKVLKPRAPRFVSFRLNVHINRIVRRVNQPVIVRTIDQRLLAYEVAQDFVIDQLPRSYRASFPQYRPNNRQVVIEYLGGGAYLVASEVTTHSPSGRRSHRAFEVIIEEGRRGWELVEIYLER